MGCAVLVSVGAVAVQHVLGADYLSTTALTVGTDLRHREWAVALAAAAGVCATCRCQCNWHGG